MRARATRFTLVFNNILQTLSKSNPKSPLIKKVTVLHSLLSIEHSFSSVSDQIKEPQIDLSSIDCSGIAKSIILRCPQVFDKKAGYCKARRFEEARKIVCQMVNSGFIELSSLEDPLSKAFVVLGFDPYAVRLRRDNYVGFSMAEFFDDLGNGLYLDTDVDEYDKKVAEVLDDSTRPDFNSLIMNECSSGNFKNAVGFVDEMIQWGQQLPISVFSTFLKGLVNYDDLIKKFCFYGRLNKAADLLNIMLKQGNLPDSTSYDSVIQGLCTCNKLSRAMDFHNEMLDWDLMPSINTWNMLVCKIARDGRTAEAERFLISMVQLGQTPTRGMYTSVIDRYRSENNLKKASELMQMMQRSGYQPDFDTHWSLISNLSDSKDDSNSSQGFLSRLLSGSGFTWKNHSKTGQQ
ncbi:hypothetical protein CCACVL1_13750 [Corchorus capsularis]|uniref:Pentacotripeptide-repeat region of PRORP domain-containing protein n=1 Tax=Corchorus capsularis TaxID=210143 RepID=A0A1R3I9U2_COCAP|nr:hypothetical protein CCACVL1_13750 [Corchorus capsularis]